MGLSGYINCATPLSVDPYRVDGIIAGGGDVVVIEVRRGEIIPRAIGQIRFI